MNKKIIIYIITIVLFSSCNKWLDINTDPNVADDIKINLMLPSIEYDIATDLSLGSSNIGFACSVFTHQITCRADYDNYGINAQSYANGVYWNDLYAGPGKEIEVLIQKGEEQDNLIYAGIGKILKAYLFSQVVDLWGDVPYSEAFVIGNYSPKFDKGKDIYIELFKLIDAGIADINNENSKNIIVPASDDMIYNGDIVKWERFANSLKLKLLTQVQKTDLFNSSEVKTLIDNDNLISTDDDFMLAFGTSVKPDNRHPGFGEYTGGQVGTYISPWFFELLMGINPTGVFNGIRDPRIPYYWCRQGRIENTPEYAYWENDPVNNPNRLKFVSIYFSSTGVNRDAGGRATFTLPGIYPVGGKFDDNTKPIDATAGLGVDDATGATYMRLLTFSDVEYTKAELFLSGLVPGYGEADAREAFVKALDYSFVLVDKAVGISETSQSVPTLSGSDDTNNYINAVLALYDAGSTDKKLEIIMTQKWIERFGGSSVDSYSDYRRTGYPVLFDPTIDASDGGNYLAQPVPTQITRGYVVSWPFPQGELDINTNAPAQKNQAIDKVFWDVN